MATPVTPSDPVSPLENLFNDGIIEPVNALEAGVGRSDRTIYSVADLAALPSASLKEGDLCHVDEGDFWMGRIDSAWAQITTAYFSSTANRDSAYAKASGAYLVTNRARAIDTSTGIEYVYVGTAWQAQFIPWTDFTPSVEGFTIGSGGTWTYAKYSADRGMARIQAKATLGSSPSLTDFQLAVPAAVTPASWFGDLAPLGQATLIDTSAGGNGRFSVPLHTALDAPNYNVRIMPKSGDNQLSVLAATPLFTPASGDVIIIAAEYPIG